MNLAPMLQSAGMATPIAIAGPALLFALVSGIMGVAKLRHMYRLAHRP